MNSQPNESQATWHDTDRVKENLRKRRASEARFIWFGRAAIGFCATLATPPILSKRMQAWPGWAHTGPHVT